MGKDNENTGKAKNIKCLKSEYIFHKIGYRSIPAKQ